MTSRPNVSNGVQGLSPSTITRTVPRLPLLLRLCLIAAGLTMAGSTTSARAQGPADPPALRGDPGRIEWTTGDDDEIIEVVIETWAVGSVVEPVEGGEDTDEVEAVPSEPTDVIQIYYTSANETGGDRVPVLVPGTDPGGDFAYPWQLLIESEDQLEQIAVDSIEQVIIHAAGGGDYVTARELENQQDLDVSMQFYGEDGNDVVWGGPGNDLVSGGADNDYVFGSWGDDDVEGGAGDDIVQGGPDVYRQDMPSDNDSVSGGSGSNVVRGGPGDDTLINAGSYDVLDYSTSVGPAGGVVIDLEGETATDLAGGTDEIDSTFAVVRGSGKPDNITVESDPSPPYFGCTVLGGPGSDTITGGILEDIIYGETGNDDIAGWDGADLIIGGSGNDTIYGGPRHTDPSDDAANAESDRSGFVDEIYGDGDVVPTVDPATDDAFPDDQFIRLVAHPLIPEVGIIEEVIIIEDALRDYAGAGTLGDAFALPCNDSLPPWPGAGSGNDTIYGNRGGDLIAGGGGNDRIWGDYISFALDRNNTLGNGSDLIFGDRVTNRPAALAANGDWGPHSPLPEDVNESKGADGSDQIRAGGGADLVIGCGGSDRINGNRGDDFIYGDFFFFSDADYLTIRDNITNPGADIIRGNEGDDVLFGGPGDDILIGGDPFDGELLDEVVVELFGDVIQGNEGFDTIIGGECILGSRVDYDDLPATQDNLDRGFGNSSISHDSSAKVYILPVPSRDTLDYSSVPLVADGGTGVYADLGNNNSGMGQTLDDGEMTSSGFNGIDVIAGIENLIGTRNDDVLLGTTRSDDSLFTGRYDNLAVFDAFYFMRFPNDSVIGTARELNSGRVGYDNIIVGLEGNDLIVGRRGEDALAGGPGDDQIWGDGQSAFTGLPPDVTNPDDPSTSGNDEIWGDEGNDRCYGEWGKDIIRGGADNDFLSGGHGEDVLDYGQPDDGPVVLNLRQQSVDLTVWGDLVTVDGLPLPFNPIGTVTPLPATTLDVPDDSTPDPTDTVTITFPGGTVLPGFVYNPLDLANNRGLGTATHGSPATVQYVDVIVNREPHPDLVDPTTGTEFNPDRFEIVWGSTSSDVIYGHDGEPTRLMGLAGHDILVGGLAADRLEGGTGSDLLEGQLGDDVLIGGAPPPTPPGVQLSTESDWISYNDLQNAASQGVVVNLAETERQNTLAAGRDRVIDVENVIGSDYNDIIKGNHRENYLYGGVGSDTLMGRADADIFQNNRQYVTSDTLNGGPGTDSADYRLGDPAQVAAAVAALVPDSCGAGCSFMKYDGEGGTDELLSIANILQPDNALIVNVPADKVISPGQTVRLDFSIAGGDGTYMAEFDPTTALEPREKEDGTPLPPQRVALLTLTVPVPGQPRPPAVREITGLIPGQVFTVYATPLMLEDEAQELTFRVTVTDMQGAEDGSGNDAPAAKVATGFVKVTVSAPMEVTIDQENYVVNAGSSVQLMGRIKGGTPPYNITWVASDGSQATTLSRTDILIPFANPTVTTVYTLRVEDTAPDSLNQIATAQTTVTVLGSSASSVPEGSNSDTDGQNTDGSSDGSDSLSGDEQSASTRRPFCAPGLGFGFMLTNLLVLVVLKRRRW